LRWLDKIVNSKELAQKLMEIIPVTHESLQREIISAIPDIITDGEQEVRDMQPVYFSMWLHQWGFF
jgi:hypothetical protein